VTVGPARAVDAVRPNKREGEREGDRDRDRESGRVTDEHRALTPNNIMPPIPIMQTINAAKTLSTIHSRVNALQMTTSLKYKKH